MVGAQLLTDSATGKDGPRPVNLRTDLAALADLIEIAFASSMDSSGRAAVREMRTVSHMPGLGLIGNALMQGMGTGFVWIQDGRLVGNVSVYPADGTGFDGTTWVVVNVAVHPDYRGRGIAYELMKSSLELIAQRGGKHAILQVDADNPTARRLYLRLGFIEERAWTTWRRSANYAQPQPMNHDPRPHITHRRSDEWQAEYRLATEVRPALMGGLGWLRPLHPHYFRRGWLGQIKDWFALRRTERLIIRAEAELLASLWVENSFTMPSTQLTLLVHPDYEGVYDEALLNTVIRRFGSDTLTLEHPTDRITTSEVLRRYHFKPRREVVHMRWEA